MFSLCNLGALLPPTITSPVSVLIVADSPRLNSGWLSAMAKNLPNPLETSVHRSAALLHPSAHGSLTSAVPSALQRIKLVPSHLSAAPGSHPPLRGHLLGAHPPTRPSPACDSSGSAWCMQQTLQTTVRMSSNYDLVAT